jgi:hypothetical protein
MLTDEQKVQMVKAGLAVPGYSAEGRAASREIDAKLREAGVVEIGRARESAAREKSARECTRESPCDIDASLVTNLLLVPLPLLLASFAFVVGQQAFASEDEGWLEAQAERSRKRRLARQRDLASRLVPVQNSLGWRLVSEDGLPTQDAYAFVAIAVVVQVALALAVAAPLRDALS